MDYSLSGSSVHGILQARILEWVAIDRPNPGIKPGSPALQADSLPSEPPGKPIMKLKSESEVAQSCLTLSDPMDCSPPGSSIHGSLQARVLEWDAIDFSTT